MNRPAAQTRASHRAAGRVVGRWCRAGGAVGVVLGVPLLLSACGDEQGEQEEGDAPRAGSERLIAAAETGMARASSFGFDNAGFATDPAVDDLRDSMEGSLAGDEGDQGVEPAQCEEPLAAVDWTPLLLGTDVARVDFGSETFTGTGSIEIAQLEDGEAEERAAEHIEHVENLVASCPETEFTLGEADYALEISPTELQALTPVSEGGSTVAYSWERSFTDSGEEVGEEAGENTEDGDQTGEAELADGTTVAQILFTEADDDVVMVSFIGEPAAGSAEFTEMAEAITEEILDELGEES